MHETTKPSKSGFVWCPSGCGMISPAMIEHHNRVFNRKPVPVALHPRRVPEWAGLVEASDLEPPWGPTNPNWAMHPYAMATDQIYRSELEGRFSPPERCNGRDPAYPELRCWWPKGHEGACFNDVEG